MPGGHRQRRGRGNEKARTGGETVSRAWQPTRGPCRLGSQPESVMSPIAPEAMDCLQLGPGLPPKWPYRQMPDRSDTSNLRPALLGSKRKFSMGRGPAIADIGLTGPANWRETPESRNSAVPTPAEMLQTGSPTSGNSLALYCGLQNQSLGLRHRPRSRPCGESPVCWPDRYILRSSVGSARPVGNLRHGDAGASDMK